MDEISKVFGCVVDSAAARSSWKCREKTRGRRTPMPQYAILLSSPTGPRSNSRTTRPNAGSSRPGWPSRVTVDSTPDRIRSSDRTKSPERQVACLSDTRQLQDELEKQRRGTKGGRRELQIGRERRANPRAGHSTRH